MPSTPVDGVDSSKWSRKNKQVNIKSEQAAQKMTVIRDMDARVSKATEVALDAFWRVVAARFPEVSTGDLDPMTAARVEHAMRAAVDVWVWCNRPTKKAN